jgi:sensor histidine kinase YesM
MEKFASGNWLIRTEVLFEDSVSSSPFGLFPTRFTTSYEIYWDGRRIPVNGVIASDREHERAGAYRLNILLQPHLTSPGKHTVIVRISDHHRFSSWRWYFGEMVLGQYGAELKASIPSSLRAFLTAGVLIVPFLFNIYLSFVRKRKVEHLVLSIICFLVIVDTMAGQIPMITYVTTMYVQWELTIYQILSVLLGILFPTFFVFLFSIPRRMIALIVGVIIFVSFFFNDFWRLFSAMSLVVLVLSSSITAWAAWMRREGGVINLLGMIPAWIAYAFGFAFPGLAAILAISSSLTTARNLAGKERAEREAQLKSARLENELLRKNINPHFLLNTLTSIIVWLRKDTKSAIKLIETLAEEFRTIMQVSALKRIPMRQELELCRAHLRIMSYRKGADFRLEASDIMEDEEIPPMIFHTLIENGLSHGYETRTKGRFTLQRSRNSDSVQFRLFNDGNFSEAGAKDSSGFGLKYIRNRLEESFPGRWSVVSQQCTHGWETIIEIRDK